MAGRVARETDAQLGLRQVDLLSRAGALGRGGGVFAGVPSGGLSFVAPAQLIKRVGQRQPVGERARVRHRPHGVELAQRRVIIAGVLFEQRQLVVGIVEIGLQRDRTLQRRTNVAGGQARFIG